VNVNYLIKQFDARVMTFYRDTSFNTVKNDFWEAGVGLQVQISKPSPLIRLREGKPMKSRTMPMAGNLQGAPMKSKSMRMAALLLAVGMVFTGMAKAQDTIKVGVLHSLSGTMAISETTLKDTILMMIDAQNKKGGLLGKNWKPLSSILHPTGRSSPKRHGSCWKRTKSR